MTDIITDTHEFSISIILHADLQIQNVVYPSTVEIGEDFDIEYDAYNTGETDTCWGHILDGVNELAGSRWEDTINAGATKHVVHTVSGGISEDKSYTIEVGYTKTTGPS